MHCLVRKDRYYFYLKVARSVTETGEREMGLVIGWLQPHSSPDRKGDA